MMYLSAGCGVPSITRCSAATLVIIIRQCRRPAWNSILRKSVLGAFGEALVQGKALFHAAPRNQRGQVVNVGTYSLWIHLQSIACLLPLMAPK